VIIVNNFEIYDASYSLDWQGLQEQFRKAFAYSLRRFYLKSVLVLKKIEESEK
jgi:hypothetical protein